MRLEIAAGYEPHPRQRELHGSGARFLLAAAGARGGKTNGAAVEFVRRIARDLQAGKGNQASGAGRDRRPRLHYWVVAPTSALLKEPKRYLQQVIPREWIQRVYQDDGSIWLHGDILIETKTADNPLHLVASGLHGMWIDEAARVKADAWLGQLRMRLTEHEGWALMSTTPLGRNWVWDEIVQRGTVDSGHYDRSYACVQWTTAENPHIPAAEIDHARSTLPYRYFAREYLASFDAFSGNVFDEWNDELHVTSEAALRLAYGLDSAKPLRTLFRRVVAGMDWGWNSPGAIMVVGEMPQGVLVALDESYQANRIVYDPRMAGDTWVGEARRLQDLWGISQIHADPSQPANVFDLSRAGLPVTGAENDVLYGVRKVSEALHPQADGKPRMLIMGTCKNLIREMRAYRWDMTRDKLNFQDLPAPAQSDHAIDALRYATVELMRYESFTAQTDSPALRRPRGPIG